ncbi:hypothetical protein NKK52_07065 [Mesorhizobium sp. C277A]|uniref:hypothetical protein n=1 Tax=unclassified Mesorhizobium TaxID=325217 RepID=UPI0003CE2E55|nr:hypothetical protein [Mesorhizobium sp. LSJC277A00]ESW69206.1 hypothetical protein X771_08505 [Mesorhizobium sp. LSJC277A00]
MSSIERKLAELNDIQQDLTEKATILRYRCECSRQDARELCEELRQLVGLPRSSNKFASIITGSRKG